MSNESSGTKASNNKNVDLLLRIEDLERALADYVHRYGFTELARKVMIKSDQG